MSDTILLIVTLTLMLGGLVGVLLPYIPSMPLIWLGVFFYGLFTQFAQISNRFLMIVSVMALATVVFDYVNVALGTRKFEASMWGVLGAVLGGFIGSLFGFVYAISLGPILGILLAEMIRGRDMAFSYHTGRFTVVGFIGGMVIKFVIGLAIMALFLYQVLGPGGI